MSKNSVVMSVSVPSSMAEWLNNHSEISASSEFQQRIIQLMTMWERQHNDLNKLQRNISAYQKELAIFTQFLENNQMYDKFLKERGKYTDGINQLA